MSTRPPRYRNVLDDWVEHLGQPTQPLIVHEPVSQGRLESTEVGLTPPVPFSAGFGLPMGRDEATQEARVAWKV